MDQPDAVERDVPAEERDDAGTRDAHPRSGAPRSPASPPATGLPATAPRATPTRASAAWSAAVGATVLLLLLAVFVAQNTQTARVDFLGWQGRAPTAVLLLLAGVAGAALVAVAGIARILQLRHRGRTAARPPSAGPGVSAPQDVPGTRSGGGR